MVLTSSQSLPLGSKAIDFKLKDTLSDAWISCHQKPSPPATVIMFLCNHCPYVKHIQKELIVVANRYQSKGVRFIALSSNDPETYPEDAPEKMKEVGLKLHYPFPYLFDEKQEVAAAYHAECTPEFFVFDNSLSLVYHGRFDDSSPGKSNPVTGKDLSEVLDLLLAGREVKPIKKPAMGCSIKWKDKT